MRKDLQGTPVYRPPGSQYLNLANNENFYATWWYEVLGGQMDDIVKALPFHQYGTASYEPLIAGYAKYLNLAPEQVLPAPGSDSLIPLLINALSEHTVLTFDVDFFRYGQFAKILKRKHVTVPTAGGVDGLIDAAAEQQADVIFFSNPNNPLGILQKRDALVKLLDSVDCYVVIDEAYAEYANESVADLVTKYPKLLVMRTLSKAWGLARLRVGFLLADADLIQYVSAVRGPFSLSDLNANIATAALAYEHLMRASVEETIQTRTCFIEFLQAYDLTVLPSASNFVFVQAADARAIAAQVLADGIALAAFDSGLRITIGTLAQMERLQNSLAKYLPSAK
ncbi:MAG: histidinol-phosphate aminotransferase family protein [Oscillospiraceae bacterium]|nr:histidinol-phosphate aminotransferase family protein [Oscillospiraceae bacterium]